MLVELTNTPRPYPWGDLSSIALWQGRTPSGQPEAELWLGTHPGSESQVIWDGGAQIPLSTWLERAGQPASLPFLVKILAAAMPLSIQVHPSSSQAREGFDRESAAGLSVDDPARNYRDTSDKPEIMIAWSERFEALVGFQSHAEMIDTLGLIEAVVGESDASQSLRNELKRGVSSGVDWLLSGSASVTALAQAITAVLSKADGLDHPRLARHSLRRVWELVGPHFPGDPGLAVASFLNHISLARGEAVFIPAGIVHAYLEGFGLEVMAPSDNVLRGGLTTKHVDVDELAAIVVKDSFAKGRCVPDSGTAGVHQFSPVHVPFVVDHLFGGSDSVNLVAEGPSVVVVESGEFHIANGPDRVVVREGHAYCFLPEGSHPASISGTGSAFVVASA
jgi:mannose-6-phosphate isomerase